MTRTLIYFIKMLYKHCLCIQLTNYEPSFMTIEAHFIILLTDEIYVRNWILGGYPIEVESK